MPFSIALMLLRETPANLLSSACVSPACRPHHLKIIEKFWMVFSHFEDVAVLTCDSSQADI